MNSANLLVRRGPRLWHVLSISACYGAQVVVQMSIILIRNSLSLPYTRLLSVLSTLLLTKVALAASSLSTHELLRPTGRVEEKDK